MTKIAYLECPTGIAGDMCLGAIVNAGVPLDYLTEGLDRLGVSEEYQLRTEWVHRNGQQATKIHVDLNHSKNSIVNNEVGQATSATTAYHLSHPPTNSASETAGASRSKEGHSPPDSSSRRHFHNHSHSHSHDHIHRQDRAHGHENTHSHSHAHSHSGNKASKHSDHRSSRYLPEIEQLILAAGLPKRVEIWSLAVFHRLAEAEAAVHGIPAEQVHFHEVGAVDAIVDIVGTCLGLDWLGIEQIFCSPLPTGGGTIWAAHGRLPVPAPAVLKLFELNQVPIYHNGIEREMVTPTGAAIASTLAIQFGPPPAMTLLRVGLGAGSIELPIPNILRLWIGEGRGQRVEGEWSQGANNSEFRIQNSELKIQNSSDSPLPTSHFPTQETIAVLETQIDDLNPQAIGYLYERLFGVGAVDVFTQAIGMKKSRSGVLLTVLCHPDAVLACEAVIFRETTTLGIRHSTQHRRILPREIQQVQTKYGVVRVKVAWLDSDNPINVQPEYEDCAQLAREQNIPWREINRAALDAWYGGWQVVGDR